jgi:uncharacterized protein
MINEVKGYALITGGSSGIGAVYADRLARRGYDLILVARSAERLKAVADAVIATSGRKVEILVADLSDRTALKRIEDVLANDDRITLLVNNAGLAPVAPMLATDADALSEVVAVNINATVRLTHAAAPRFAERGHGAIINISSGVAIALEMINSVYSASKAFILAFSQSLKHEFGENGVRIQVVLPGATATEAWAKNGMPVENLPKEIVMSTDDLVDAALAGFDLGEFVTAPSLADQAEWDRYDQARKALAQNISRSAAAPRYTAAKQ